MKPTERSRALQLAIVNIEWMIDAEHPQYDRAVAILRDTRTQATIASGSGSSSGGRHAKGSHSDPTGTSVVGQLADGASDNAQSDTLFEAAQRHIATMAGDVRDIAETADFLRATVTRVLYDVELPTPRASLAQALADAEWCNTIDAKGWRLGAAITARAWTEEAAELDDAIERLAQRSAALRAKVSRVLYRATRPEEPPKPVAKEPECCISCARLKGHFEPIALHPNGQVKYATLCRMCGDYKGHAGRIPPIGVVEARRDGKMITNKVIEAALRAEAQQTQRARGA